MTKVACAILSASCALALAEPARAGSRDQAYRIYSRVAGVPPSPATLDQMDALIQGGKAVDAAMLAVADPSFYNVTLRNWVLPWTNKDVSGRVALNDYSATVIGMVRDDANFADVLSSDVLYTAKAGLTGVPAYSPLNNDHYAALDTLGVDLMANLQKTTQAALTGLATTSGVMTTRGFGEAFYNMGTNRAAVRFTYMTYLCADMDQMHDTTVPDFRVRQDVDRAPGGETKVYKNKCAGCHGGMDAQAGAFSHFDFVGGRTTFDATTIAPKYLQNSVNFPDGYVTSDDGWMNLWAVGQNSTVGWNGATEGNGPASYGRMITASDTFPVCIARRVYASVCLKALADVKADDVKTLAEGFKADQFNVKRLFARTATECMGE
jgi:hypothetical protein